MNSNSNKPIHPSELFNKLLATDYKQAECVDEGAKIKMEREILVNLVAQYEGEVRTINQRMMDERSLAEIRDKLIYELQILKQERNAIAINFENQINGIRRMPLDHKQIKQWQLQITQARSRNSKLKVRIKDIFNYLQKLQLQNRRLEQERRILQINIMEKRQHGEESWRTKIEGIRRQEVSYGEQLKMRMRDKEEHALRSLHQQELQIRERNRIRMQNVKNGIYQSKQYVSEMGSNYRDKIPQYRVI